MTGKPSLIMEYTNLLHRYGPNGETTRAFYQEHTDPKFRRRALILKKLWFTVNKGTERFGDNIQG